MPTLKLQTHAQALVLEYALATGADNERDKSGDGLGLDAIAELESACESLRVLLRCEEKGRSVVTLDLIACAAASRYLEAIEGGAESIEDLSADAFEDARRSLLAAFEKLDRIALTV